MTFSTTLTVAFEAYSSADARHLIELMVDRLDGVTPHSTVVSSFPEPLAAEAKE